MTDSNKTSDSILPSMTYEADDIRLIQDCRKGDRNAWEHLLDKYERLVFSIARNTGLSAEDATDITQLTFTYLLEGLDKMTDEGNLAGWLATVAKRHSRRLLVRQLRYQSTQLDPSLVTELIPEHPGSSGIEKWEMAEWLNTGLARIDERCRQLLLALYFEPEEPSYTEIDERFGLAVGSVGPIRARCIERLRESLGGSGSQLSGG